jgi:hypothetical protein
MGTLLVSEVRHSMWVELLFNIFRGGHCDKLL